MHNIFHLDLIILLTFKILKKKTTTSYLNLKMYGSIFQKVKRDSWLWIVYKEYANELTSVFVESCASED